MTTTKKPARASTAKRGKAAKATVGASKLHALVARPALATLDHGGLAEEAFAWGARWLIPIALDGASKYSEGNWAFSLVDVDGREASRTVLENVPLAKVLLAQDELVLILGATETSLRVEVYRQTAAGTLERVAARPGDASTVPLWKCWSRMIALEKDVLLVQDLGAKALVVYRIRPGFVLEQLSSTKIQIGEKSQFIDNEGFSGAALAGTHALLAGPAQKTGYQILDLSDPRKPQPIATAKATGPTLQETVAFVGADQMLAYGAGGQAMFLEHAAGKLTAQKSMKVGQLFSGMHREGDECLLYGGNVKPAVGHGVAPGRDLGKVALPVDACAISAIGERVMFTGSARSVIVQR